MISVVVSNDRKQLCEAETKQKQPLSKEDMKDTVVLIFANKQARTYVI